MEEQQQSYISGGPPAVLMIDRAASVCVFPFSSGGLRSSQVRDSSAC